MLIIFFGGGFCFLNVVFCYEMDLFVNMWFICSYLYLLLFLKEFEKINIIVICDSFEDVYLGIEW